MTIDELNQKLEEANTAVLNWERINGNVKELHLAVFEALEQSKEAIIEYLKDKESK